MGWWAMFRKRWWVLMLGLPVLLVGWAALRSFTGPEVMPDALRELEAGTGTADHDNDWIVFAPDGDDPVTGLVFYPGARIDAHAYAPLAAQIAANGFLVVIPRMPFKLALLAPGRAASVMENFSEVKQWVVGGHSLGGVAAVRFAARNPERVAGLVLWAAYPASSDDLSASDLAVTSIYATRDGLTSLDQIESSRPLLPPDAIWIAIDGGNHSQFGWYGLQAGDMVASIGREEQAVQIVEATLSLLEGVSPR
jgi:pimeloyl-ACP methyl ester carboxylesterase